MAKAWHDTENSAMYSTQCISVNVQCTSNTIQPESRIKKVETQKRKKEITCYKWQSPEAFFAQRRIHHAEAIERNKRVCDRCPTCPTALLLVLHITTVHVTIAHIYRSLLVISDTFCSPSQNLLSSSPLIHFPLSMSFYIPIYSISHFILPLLLTLSSYLSLSHSVSRGLKVQEVFSFLSAVVDHKLNTERKCVRWFCWWCACTCMAALLLPIQSSFCPLSLLLQMSLERSVGSCLLSSAPSSPSSVLLPMMLLRNYKGRMRREGNCVLSDSFLHLLKYPLYHLAFFHSSIHSSIHPLPLLLLHHPLLPLDPGVWWGWIVAGLIVELAVGPRRWVEVYIVAGGFEALQVHVEIALRGAPSWVNLVLVESLVLEVDAVRRGRVLERRVGFWRHALRRDLWKEQRSLTRQDDDYDYDHDGYFKAPVIKKYYNDVHLCSKLTE